MAARVVADVTIPRDLVVMGGQDQRHVPGFLVRVAAADGSGVFELARVDRSAPVLLPNGQVTLHLVITAGAQSTDHPPVASHPPPCLTLSFFSH